ncbi:hypothetical protein [Vibrio spartinae]|uniref:DUF2235 domain-containing protein n=1 Tax=Vibrio spartinae TaxID=1918945 RepID=A0A1N6M8N0_9VIBR|nr:hypothetical protein [Vibrio spartinae]SIO95706.1 hypothetical protein VSP9026_03458 [Vibrio spartinae]
MKLHIFYNGTDSNYESDFREQGRFIHGEIVSRFGKYAKDVPRQSDNVLRINGVGGSKGGNAISSGAGTAFGVQMRSDVQDIVTFVMNTRTTMKAAIQQGHSHDTELVVTMMGWSRGGIGCIYAANMVSKVWCELDKFDSAPIVLKIKIVAMDPVSGGGTNVRALDMGWLDLAVMSTVTWISSYTHQFGETVVNNLKKLNNQFVNWWELPEYVTEYHGFYAHDERSAGFATTMPTMTGLVDNRSFHLYGVPGTHSTLVGNLYPYGGGKAATNGAPSQVGLHIYRSVVRKVAQLMDAWHVEFHADYVRWLQSLNIHEDLTIAGVPVITLEELAHYKSEAQLVSIVPSFFNPLNQKDVGPLTDGRGVYIGGNKQDRKWKPASTISQFMNEQNTKSSVDSMWQWIVGSETKLEKLGGNVQAHDYNFADSDWT